MTRLIKLATYYLGFFVQDNGLYLRNFGYASEIHNS